MIAAMLVAASAMAQIYNLTITKSNGEKIVIPTKEISRLEFVEEEGGDGDVPKADLLDVVFRADGTAEDVSPMRHAVITKAGGSLMTYYSDLHKRYVANFKNSLGGSTTTGFYRVEYKAGDDFISRVADGCTFETIIMLGEEDPPGKEVKWFSSMQAGGIGFILPMHSRSKCLTFLPNVSESGASTWRWTHSSVAPEPGKYYHVVGVWNKEEGKSYIYVNGVLSGTTQAPGNYVPVQSGAEAFIIGGDPDVNVATCSNSWNGDVVLARIYDAPLAAGQVAKLWEASRFDEDTKGINISGLQYMPECEVAPGYKYTIYGTGFEAGDVMVMKSAAGSSSLSVATEVGNGCVTMEIPAGLASGTYQLGVKRGATERMLCTVDFAVVATPQLPAAPKIIAHRGAHTDGAPENSIAALKKAMDAGYFGVELDVWTTTDGTVVVQHDGKLNNVTFQNSDYQTIKDFTLANGETLPTLESFIAAYKEKMGSSASKLIIEIKTHSTTERNNRVIDLTMQQVEAAGIKDRVEYIAFSLANCQRILANDRDAVVGYLNGDKTPAEVQALGIRGIDYKNTVLDANRQWVRDAANLGVTVNVWTVNDQLEMLRYMSRGVTYITTDSPALLKELAGKVYVNK